MINRGGTEGDAVPHAEQAIRMVVSAFTAAFPGRVRACFVEGSYADDAAVTTSDLDLVVVFQGIFVSDAEREAAAQAAAACGRDVPVELDIDIQDEETLMGGASPSLKLGSALVYGEDVRERLPLIALGEWTRDRMHTSWWRIARLFARPAILALPLEYPDATDEFRGYIRRTVRLSDGTDVLCTRDLVRMVGWSATALLALQRGVYVARKRECHHLYRQEIGGRWAGFLDDVYTLCRSRWSYLVPSDPAECAQLRAVCDRTLGFERHFTSVYQGYLLDELNSGDRERVQFAIEVMARAPLLDGAILEALMRWERGEDVSLRQAARAALIQMTHVSGPWPD